MHWVITPYVLPLLVSAAVSGIFGIFLWSRRITPGSRPFAALLIASATWALFYAIEITVQELSVKEVIAGIEYVGIVAIPVCWLLFSLEYAGISSWSKASRILLLAFIPFMVLVLYWTNSYHQLVWIDPHLDHTTPFPVVSRQYGPAFWIFAAYAYSLLIAGVYFLIRANRQTSLWYARQTLPLILAILIPWIGNLIYITGVNPLPYLDLTPFLFALSAAVLVWGVVRYWTFDLVPLTRAAVIDVLEDGILIADEQGRLVDINGVAARAFGISGPEAIGQKLSTLLPRYPQFWQPSTLSEDSSSELVIENGASPRYFELRIMPVYDRWRNLSGRSYVIHEITQRKVAEQEIERTNTLLLATLEATADGILVVNARGKMIHFNRKFAETWRIPADVEKRGDDQELMAFILDQLSNPAAFYRLMNKLSVQPDAESYDVLELKDGRIFERYSRPQKVDDRRVGRVWSFHDITEQRRAEERLRFLSTHDILTGLYNRVYFEEELNRLEGSRQYPISLIMADVDGLKETNDRYGHLAGDALLRRAAEILRQACRTEDMVARIGGDEFGIVLPYSDSQVADRACKRVTSLLNTLRVGDLELSISLSLGAATANNGESLRKVLRQADKTMYLAKRAKRISPNNVSNVED